MQKTIQKVTHQGLITFFDRVEKSEEGLASLDVDQSNEGVNCINRSHEHNDENGLLLLGVLPVKEMLWHQLEGEMHGSHHTEPWSHHSEGPTIHCCNIHFPNCSEQNLISGSWNKMWRVTIAIAIYCSLLATGQPQKIRQPQQQKWFLPNSNKKEQTWKKIYAQNQCKKYLLQMWYSDNQSKRL